jgi:hypothetical protein
MRCKENNVKTQIFKILSFLYSQLAMSYEDSTTRKRSKKVSLTIQNMFKKSSFA